MSPVADAERARRTAVVLFDGFELLDVFGPLELFGVLPVRWAGPTLDVGASQVAMETLELAHEGFLL